MTALKPDERPLLDADGKTEVLLIQSLIWGGVAGLSIAIFEIVVWHTRLHWLNGLSIAICPTSIFFLSAEMDGSTGVLWLATLAVCVTNSFMWAGFVGIISTVVQKLFHASQRSS